MVAGEYIIGSGFKDQDLGMGIWGMWQSVISELKVRTYRCKQIHAKIVILNGDSEPEQDSVVGNLVSDVVNSRC